MTFPFPNSSHRFLIDCSLRYFSIRNICVDNSHSPFNIENIRIGDIGVDDFYVHSINID